MLLLVHFTIAVCYVLKVLMLITLSSYYIAFYLVTAMMVFYCSCLLYYVLKLFMSITLLFYYIALY